MELQVERDQLLSLPLLARDTHLLDDFFEATIVVGSKIGHGEPRGEAFQLSSDVLDGDRILERYARDERAAIGQAGQQSLVFEAANRLAHRLATDPKPTGEVDLEHEIGRASCRERM